MDRKILGLSLRLLVIITAVFAYFYLKNRVPTPPPKDRGPIRGVVVKQSNPPLTLMVEKCRSKMARPEVLVIDPPQLTPSLKQAVQENGIALSVYSSQEIERIKKIFRLSEPNVPHSEIRFEVTGGCYIAHLQFPDL